MFVIRYPHTIDVTKAHEVVLHSLLLYDKTNKRYNMSNEVGFLVLKLIEVCDIVTDKKLYISYNGSNSTDLSILVSSRNKTYPKLR